MAIVYLLFSKDWKSLSQMFMINKVYINNTAFVNLCYIRAFFITANELVLFAVLCCTNLAEDRILGLVVNFSAALIICELDDIVMNTGRMQY